MVWKHASLSTPKKFKVTPYVGKKSWLLFLGQYGVIMTDHLSKGSIVTGAHYADELRKLREALKSKRGGKLRRGVPLLHDNVPAHTFAVVTSAVAECGYELLPHPLYSPALAPSDFCLFPLLKEHFSGTHFSSDKLTMTSLHLWRSFFRGKMNSSTRLTYKGCRNDGTSALKLADSV